MWQHQMPLRTGQASSDLHTTIRGVAGGAEILQGLWRLVLKMVCADKTAGEAPSRTAYQAGNSNQV